MISNLYLNYLRNLPVTLLKFKNIKLYVQISEGIWDIVYIHISYIYKYQQYKLIKFKNILKIMV